MKHKLTCILFGHSFVAEKHNGTKIYEVFSADWCQKCGLTKKELGISATVF